MHCAFEAPTVIAFFSRFKSTPEDSAFMRIGACEQAFAVSFAALAGGGLGGGRHQNGDIFVAVDVTNHPFAV